jgi:ABC-2 type transport system permease protein
MAVHSHVFRPYEGVRTSLRTRWLVVARYALRDALALKRTLALLVLAAFPLLAGAALIYLHHNLEAVTILPAEMVKGLTNALPINAKFFYWLLTIEGYVAFVLTAAIGPRILVNDFRDNGLPLYLSRPLTRVDYVLGKAAAIAFITSLVTWVPLLLLVGLQSTLERGWLLANWWVVPAILLGAWSAIALFALASLAVAAVLRRRAMAEASFVAMFIVVPLVAVVIDQFLHARWAIRLFLPAIYESLWTPLFRLQQSNGLSAGGALVSLTLALVLASTVLLRRVRAWEIVR